MGSRVAPGDAGRGTGAPTAQTQGGAALRAFAQRHPYISLAVAIVVLVGAIWLAEGGQIGEERSQVTAVTLAGAVGGVTPRVGESAPNFTLETLDGQTLSLAELRGKPVMVNFWASWCPPCRAEMPDIEAVWRDYREAGLVVVGVNFQEDRSAAQWYVDTAGITFPVVLDRNAAVANRYNLTGLPTTYFIDRGGIIREMNIGPLTTKALRSRVAKVVS